ncbi:zf-DHHC-domain-containing protein [Rhizoclosmatium globosum]|uniref:Palmitoyltransferase n=1 Tax=Rhizoclosmatium globosum TaxID=329046 RepID=A0A1Y2BV73_9FUNG|nr:zf-DHHC-domain-containing protein [Rhizoclosmatium globosum]|eukprot:ORY38574.1 zf-DHHC-domain-containing protein [Rhizoclosmatium globosum]
MRVDWDLVWKGLAWIPVGLTVLLVAWSYYGFVGTAIWQLKGWDFALVSVPYHIVLLLWAASYFRVIATLPGYPHGARKLSTSATNTMVDTSDIEQQQGLLNESSIELEAPILQEPTFVSLETKRDGKPRYCKKCQAWKPDRAHHCSQCGICVLRMGWKNHKFFFLFLFYTVIYCAGICIYLVQHLIRAFKARHVSEIIIQLNLHWLFLIFVSGAFGVVLLTFLGMHVVYVLTNKTTIESMERARRIRLDGYSVSTTPAMDTEMASTRAAASSIISTTTPTSTATTAWSQYGVNIFDVGAKENWKAVMGRDWRVWFLPIDSSEGDGHTFPINYDAMEKLRRMSAATSV